MEHKNSDGGAFDALLHALAAAPPLPLVGVSPSTCDLPVGTVVDGELEIVGRLGAGGMGIVYLGRDLTLEREVAIKVMRLDRITGDVRARLLQVFVREAKATGRLVHPNLVTLHRFGDWNGLLYLVLERLEGETLAERLTRGRLAIREAMAIFTDILQGLAHAHEAGIVHRDLKPQNVFLCRDGRVKVLDFGLAGLAEAVGTTPPTEGTPGPGTLLSRAGTPAYMAPEQWRGATQDQRVDVWAAGVVLFELLTGGLPDRASVREPTATPIPSNRPRQIPRSVFHLLSRMLAVDPAMRPKNAAAVLRELRSTRPTKPKGWALASAGFGLTLAIAAVALWRTHVLPPRRTAATTSTPDLSGVWRYDDGHQEVRLTRGSASEYALVSTNGPFATTPSPGYRMFAGTLELVGNTLSGDVADVPGSSGREVGHLVFVIEGPNRLLRTESIWGATLDHITAREAPLALGREQ